MRARLDQGAFVISLDFELAWGLRPYREQAQWLPAALGVWEVVPRLLDLLCDYGVHATWATVGLIMCEDAEDALAGAPEVRPEWASPRLSPYAALGEMGSDPDLRRAHFAPELVREIASRSGQEIGTHTFAHYPCAEAGHTPEAFRADLGAALAVAKRHDLTPRSIVFPRNQVRADCLKVCAEQGIEVYRGVLPGALHEPRSERERGAALRRLLRMVDAHVGLRGSDCFLPAPADIERPANVPGSRLLRTAAPRLPVIEGLRLGRIMRCMTYAARRGLVYHLWWHPYNFVGDTQRKLAALARVLEHLRRLRETFGMRSCNMLEMARSVQAAVDAAHDEERAT